MKKISATGLAKKLEMSTQEVFSNLETWGLIQNTANERKLTEKGKSIGGEYLSHPTHGEYIAWPEKSDIFNSLKSETIDKEKARDLATISSKYIAKQFNISPQKVNAVLSELGWIKKALKGWNLTIQGAAQGGCEVEHSQSGAPYVKWPRTILVSQDLKHTIAELTGSHQSKDSSSSTPIVTEAIENSFRERFPATYRATDGHMIRSKAEMLIDNWLYMAEIVHAYERKLPVEEEIYCDFYIPTGKVYIEYWGYENDKKYLARKQTKKSIYKKYNFKLIELNDEQVQNLDDTLPRLLLKYGIQSY